MQWIEFHEIILTKMIFFLTFSVFMGTQHGYGYHNIHKDDLFGERL